MTCSITSHFGYEETKWYHNGTLIETNQTKWVLKKRICTSEDTENCTVETDFNLIIENADCEKSGYYSCACVTENGVPNLLYFEILSGKC